MRDPGLIGPDQQFDGARLQRPEKADFSADFNQLVGLYHFGRGQNCVSNPKKLTIKARFHGAIRRRGGTASLWRMNQLNAAKPRNPIGAEIISKDSGLAQFLDSSVKCNGLKQIGF